MGEKSHPFSLLEDGWSSTVTVKEEAWHLSSSGGSYITCYTPLLSEQREAEGQKKKEQLERNNTQRRTFREALDQWNEESAQVKVKKQWPWWEKPKLGKLEPPILKLVVENGERNGTDGNEEENGKESDEGLESNSIRKLGRCWHDQIDLTNKCQHAIKG